MGNPARHYSYVDKMGNKIEIQMINIGLIGFGYWGPNVAKNIHANKDLNLYSICDYKEDRLEKAKSIYIEDKHVWIWFYKKLLTNPHIQAIAVAVETSGHYKLVKEALLAGKHVYVEKPFTSTVKEAEELQELARIKSYNSCRSYYDISSSN